MTTAWKWAIPVILTLALTVAANWPTSSVKVLEHRANALESRTTELEKQNAAIVELKVAVARIDAKLDAQFADMIRELDRLADQQAEALKRGEERPPLTGRTSQAGEGAPRHRQPTQSRDAFD